jgi:HPt (histidine-containing phosphotransfer) domain-containing protein
MHLGPGLTQAARNEATSRKLKALILGGAEGFQVLDMGALRALCGDDEQFIFEVLTTFAESAQQILADIDHAIRTSQATSVAQCAHKLRGAAANACFAALAAVADRLETAPKTEWAGAYQELCIIWSQGVSEIERITGRGQASAVLIKQQKIAG